MHYQIVYMKRGFPLTTWASSAERAHQLAEQLRRVGYSVDVWQHTEKGSRKTPETSGRKTNTSHEPKGTTMKKLNVYSVYLDDGKDVFRVTVPAASKKDAAEYVRGNGNVVAIKPADLQDIDLDALADTLKRAQWGQMEIDIITRALAACGLDR